MPDPYVGEIRMFGGNFAPLDWAFCDGSLLAISENDVLFNLIGTTYGGDGQTTFALPDLRGRCPVHQGGGFVIGQSGGAETVTLTLNQLPQHQHLITASSSPGTQSSPVGAIPAADASAATTPYSSVSASNSMAANALGSAGGSQPHENMPPFLAINFIISLFGIFPSQT